MNHTAVVGSIGAHLQLKDNISHYGLPYILGESNSISGQGVDGITDVFGSALWVVDYSLWAAANVHLSDLSLRDDYLWDEAY